MTINVNLKVMLAKRKMTLKKLSKQTGVTTQNLSILNRGQARAIRFSTLSPICKVLQCQPGDLFEYDENTDIGRADIEGADMAINIKLKAMLAKRNMTINELSEHTGITHLNLSNINAGRARSMRFSTLSSICKALQCQPGDLLEYNEDRAEIST